MPNYSPIGPFLGCDQKLCFQRILFLAERMPQLRQGNILQLADTLAPDFVSRRLTGFQVKKPDMPPSVIRDEMRPKGVLLDAIRELADAPAPTLSLVHKDRLQTSIYIR